MSVLLALFALLGFGPAPHPSDFPPPPAFGFMHAVFAAPFADNDGDGVRARKDCDDSDPTVWLLYCHDDGDGVGDLDSPLPPVCTAPGGAPPGEGFVPCP